MFILSPLVFFALALFFEFVDGGFGRGFLLGFHFSVGFFDFGFLDQVGFNFLGCDSR